MGDVSPREPAGWPRGRAGVIAMVLVVISGTVGVVGAVVEVGTASWFTHGATIADPLHPRQTDVERGEAYEHKAEPAVRAFATPPARPQNSSRPHGGSGGGSGGSAGGGSGSGTGSRAGSGAESGSDGGTAGPAASTSSAVLDETNVERFANDLDGLAWNDTLASRACSWASHLADVNGDLVHSSFAGGFSRWGENIAYGYGSASAVVDGWMNSPGHRANILTPEFSKMGACFATSTTGRIYWVQQFGA